MLRFARLLRLLTATTIAAGSLVVGGAPIGCDGEGSGTTGRRISLEVRIEASPESRTFTNAQGWNVTITRAAVSTGPLYFYDGEPLFARRGWWTVRTAHAHPGHYAPGNAKGELRTPASADLLAGATLGQGDGVSGFVRSATFAFSSPATGAMASELGANVIVVEGTATKDAASRTFRAEIGVDEVKDAEGVPEIRGCPFTEADMQSDGIVTISVKLTTWFDQVAFDDVPESVDGSPVVLGEGLARNQLVRGTKVGAGYAFSYAPRQ